MSRIGKEHQANLQAATTAKRQLEAATAALQIEPSGEVRRQQVTYLSRLRTTTRRPPELRLNLQSPEQHDALDQVLLPEIARIAETETTEFAFSVAELAWRLEGAVEATGDEGAKEGLAVLSQAARMYEHLFMLQSGVEG
jgi:hypothetical protein